MKTTQKADRKTHILRREDFTDYALDLGIWEGLTKDHGVSPTAKEIEIEVVAVRRVE